MSFLRETKFHAKQFDIYIFDLLLAIIGHLVCRSVQDLARDSDLVVNITNCFDQYKEKFIYFQGTPRINVVEVPEIGSSNVFLNTGWL